MAHISNRKDSGLRISAYALIFHLFTIACLGGMASAQAKPPAKAGKTGDISVIHRQRKSQLR
jgi:hypothetical protein